MNIVDMHIYEGGIKGSYDAVVSAVHDISTNGIQAMKHQWKSVWTAKGTLLENKCHLLTFHESILVSL